MFYTYTVRTIAPNLKDVRNCIYVIHSLLCYYSIDCNPVQLVLYTKVEQHLSAQYAHTLTCKYKNKY